MRLTAYKVKQSDNRVPEVALIQEWQRTSKSESQCLTINMADGLLVLTGYGVFTYENLKYGVSSPYNYRMFKAKEACKHIRKLLGDSDVWRNSCPHLPQNKSSESTSAAHLEQLNKSSLPYLRQYRFSWGFSFWHFGHFIFDALQILREVDLRDKRMGLLLLWNGV